MKEILKKSRFTNYDVVVIGAGHAGCEAALASARNKSRTLLINISMDSIAIMPFGNTVGGLGKGHLLREIDFLGSEITRNIDKTFLNITSVVNKNNNKEKVLQATVDKRSYFLNMKNVLEKQELLDLRQGLVVDIEKDKRYYLVKTSDGISYRCKSVVVSTGTFMKANIFWGNYKVAAGRQGEINSNRLPEKLARMGFNFKRNVMYSNLQIDGKTIDFKRMKAQPFDKKPGMFVNYGKFDGREQLNNYITCAGSEFIDCYLSGFTVINRYGEKFMKKMALCSHENRMFDVLIKPEGRNTGEFSIFGLPIVSNEDEQLKLIRKIIGLEKAEITRPGYGVKYDYLAPLQLMRTMESRAHKGIFFSGMVTGSTNYEESASQGIIAGLNASRAVKNLEYLILSREDGYLGLLLNEIGVGNRQVPLEIIDLIEEYKIGYSLDNTDLRMLKVLKFLNKKDEIKKIEGKYKKSC